MGDVDVPEALSRSCAAERVHLETKELSLGGDVPAGRLLSQGDIAQTRAALEVAWSADRNPRCEGRSGECTKHSALKIV